MTPTKPCLFCGKIIEKQVTCSKRAWKERVKFCSRSCHMKNTQASGKCTSTRFKKGCKAINPIKKGQRLSPKTEFKKGHAPHHKGTKGKMKAWNKGIEHVGVQGEKHWNWKGGKNFKQRIRNCLLYQEWRKKVFISCNHKCVVCGTDKQNDHLRVDHIIPFSQIIKSNNINTLEEAKLCDELWDVTNGRILCLSCDKKSETYLYKQWKLISNN